MKSKPKQPIPQKPEEQAEEWDLSKGMGILPPDISLTQNIGCVGIKNKNSYPKILDDLKKR
jgi:hypothetical protein